MANEVVDLHQKYPDAYKYNSDEKLEVTAKNWGIKPDMLKKLTQFIKEGSKNKEDVHMARLVKKVNKRDKSQERLLVVTNAAIYNFSPGQVNVPRRRVQMKMLGGFTVSTNSNEFVMHVPSEYAMVFECNLGDGDRLLRLAVGSAMMAVAMFGPKCIGGLPREWGYAGAYPVTTSLVGYDPVYECLGHSTNPQANLSPDTKSKIRDAADRATPDAWK